MSSKVVIWELLYKIVKDAEYIEGEGFARKKKNGKSCEFWDCQFIFCPSGRNKFGLKYFLFFKNENSDR